MKVRFALCVCLVMAILAVHPSTSFAQAIATARLSGTVTDPSGGVVAKAHVTVSNTSTNVSYSGSTNDSGFYVLPSLPPGTYDLTVTSSGFANYRQTGIVLTVGQSATVDASLQLASAGEKVVVTAETPVIEPTKTEISQVVETKQIGSLPTSGRVFTDFALLAPGVATSRTSLGTTFTEFEVTQISFGGMRGFSNEIMMDGADFISVTSGIQRATPPQESVQEFRVVNNSFGAEYGRAVGGIVNIVTKSGSNDFHGTLYEYFQDNALDARSLLQAAPLPDSLSQNQFGGLISGPIKKDKTFFLLNYEGKRRSESPVYPPDLVCFTPGVSTCSSTGGNLTVIDNAKAMMGLAPEGCFTGLGSCTATPFSYLNGFLKTSDDDFGFARLDTQFGSNQHLSLRYNIVNARASGELVGATLDGGGIGVPSGGRQLYIPDQAVVGTLTSVISPNLVNTFLGQWAQRHYNFYGATGQPDFSILNDLELGHNFGTNDRYHESRLQFSDSISWVKGNHNWKFGFDGNYIWSDLAFPGFTPVRMLVPGVSCLADFAIHYNSLLATPGPILPGVAGSAATCAVPQDNGVVFMYAGTPLPSDPNACQQPGSGPGPCVPLVTAANPLNTSTWANAYPPSLFSHYNVTLNHAYWAGFAQDQWRITPKLTINYGLRWEVETGLTSIVNKSYNGWQPRVGLAYSPDSKTVIRAGFGMFDDRYNLTFFFVPNTQKVVAGYQCGNHAPAAIATACQTAGMLPQQFPNIRSGLAQATQGYQLLALPGAADAAGAAASIIRTGGYDTAFPAVSMNGTCSMFVAACGIGQGGMDHNARIPYAEQASAEIDRQFGGGFALSLSYLFVGAHKLVRGNNINIPCPLGTSDAGQDPLLGGTATDPGTWGVAQLILPPFLWPEFPDWVPGMKNANGTLSKCKDGTAANPSGAPILGTGALAGLGPWFQGAGPSAGLQTMSSGLEDYNNGVANAVYHGLTVTGMERWGKYFNLVANYTYSHTIDNGNFTTFINLPVNQLDYAAERSNSNQDVRHRFVANFTANTPTTGWYRNFELSSIITLQAGRPFTIFYGANTLNDVAGGATDRVGGAPLTPHCTTASTCQTMIPRNTFIGDTLDSWDLRLSRVIHTTERTQLTLGVDVFNAFNRQNVDEVTSVYGSPVFCGGVIPRNWQDAATKAIQAGAASAACPAGPIAVPGGTVALTPIANKTPSDPCFPTGFTCLFIPTTPNSSFGKPRTMFNPRQIQFGVKFSF